MPPIIWVTDATPVIPPVGEIDKVTDGIERYPAPLFDIAKLLTPPSLGVPAIAVAVTPTPTIVEFGLVQLS